MKVTSQTTGKTYDLAVYSKNDGTGETRIITHRSLNDAYERMDDKERPVFKIEPFDVSKMPEVPPMYAVKGIMEKGDTHIEALGEMLCIYWQESPEITRKFPLTICKNIAFDRCFLQYMKFKIEGYDTANGIYSSSEIDVTGKDAVLLTSRSVPSNAHPSETSLPNQAPQYVQTVPDVQVLNVTRDQAHPVAQLSTTAGNLYYNAANGMFSADQGIDITQLDLQDIYQQASNLLRQGLAEYLLGN